MYTAKRKDFAKIVVLFISIMLILSASMPTYFVHGTGEKYTEAQIAEANKALDDFLAGEYNNLITNGGTWNAEKEYGRLKSQDGLTYTIGYKMSTSNTPDFTSLNFNFRKFTKHRATVFFEGSALDAKTAPNGTQTTIKIKKRPTDKDITVNARLALFEKTSNNIQVQEGKIDPIAQRNIKIILKAPKSENAPVRISVKAYDKDSGKELLKDADNLSVNLYKDKEGREPIANLDGKYDYNVQKNISYYLSVKADNYENYFEECKPTQGGDYKVNLKKKEAAVSEEDTDSLNKISNELNNLYALRPNFATDKNINEFAKSVLKNRDALKGIDFSKVKLEVVESKDTNYIKNDGTIVYKKGELNDYFTANVSVIFKIYYGTASIQAKKHTVTVGWDREYYKQKIEEEAAKVDKNFITKNQALDLDAVEKNFTLPTVLKEDKRNVWSEIIWSSSNSGVISIKNDPTKPFASSAVVKRTTKEETVTLTATFVALDNHLNSNLNETVETFPKVKKTFVVKVKPVQSESAEELKALLDKYYKDITDYGTGAKSSLKDLMNDLQLPRYTRIKDENGKLVFQNKEIKVTSDNPGAVVNGYRVAIDPFAEKKDSNLTVTFTRNGVTATKKIPFTIGSISNEDLDKEIKMMDYAKAHYFDGIKGNNKTKNDVRENLRAFQEMYLDKNGEAVWVYEVNGVKGTGVKPDNFFEDSFEAEANGYNKFKSSNNNVVTHENLKVTRQEKTTEVEISSLLSSERFGKWAPKHPENAKLQSLYKQEAKATIKVKGTKDSTSNLVELINQAKALSQSAVEGDNPGEYPSGAKNALDAAVAKAEKLLKTSPTEEQIVSEITELENAVKAFKDKQNVKKATIWVTAGKDNNKLFYAKKIDVRADLAKKYGYVKAEKYSNEVTVIDALAAMHADKYRGDFEANPQNYLKSGPEGWLTKIFGIETFNISYLVNYNCPLLSPGLGSVANNTVLKDNDIFSIAILQGMYPKLDVFLSFKDIEKDVEQNEEFALTLYSNHFVDDTTVKPSPLANTKVQLTDFNGKKVAEAVTDDKGMAKFKVDKAGKYMAGVIADGDKPFENFEQPYCEITVKTMSIWDFDKATKTLKGFKAGENFDNQAMLDIPDEIDGVPVEHIADSAFKYALWGSKVKNKITELRIPASVKSIGKDAFKGNDTLTTLKFKSEGDNESSLEKIDEGAFMSCGLQSLDIPSDVKEIGKGAFSMNNIEKLILPESLEKLGEGAFGCNLIESVIIPSGVKEFPTAGNGVFYKNFREKTQGSSYKGSLRYVKVFDQSGKATAFNTGGVVNPVPVKVKYVDQDGKSLRDEEIVYGCKYQTTYESYGKVTLGNGDKSFLKNYNGSNGTNSGNTPSEIFKRKELADVIIGQNYFRDGQEYVFPKENAPSIEGYVKPEKDIKKTITQTDYVVEYVYQSKAPAKVDKTELEKALKAAEDAKKNIKTSADGKDVEPADKWTTTEEMKALEEAIAEARKVDEDANAKQEAVNKVKADLENATKKFTDSLKDGIKEEPVKPDKADLKKAINDAEDVRKGIKTSAEGKDVEPSEQWTTDAEMKALEKAIAEARKVDEDANAKQEAVNKAKADLENATKKFTDSLKAGMKVQPPTPENPEDNYLKVVTEGQNDNSVKTEGNKIIYTKGVSTKAVYRIVADGLKADDLSSVLLDGYLVDEKNYDVKPGSIIVSFKKAYVDSLATGTHKITFKTSKGDAKAELIVKQQDSASSELGQTDDASKGGTTTAKDIVKDKGTAKTGDTENALGYAGLAIVALGAGYVITRRKKSIS